MLDDKPHYYDIYIRYRKSVRTERAFKPDIESALQYVQHIKDLTHSALEIRTVDITRVNGVM